MLKPLMWVSAEPQQKTIIIGDGASTGSTTINSGTGNIALVAAGANGDINLTTANGAINLTAAGANGVLSIDATEASNITITSDAASENLTISLAGATASSLILSSTGTGADALQVTTTAGGIDITTTGAAADEDIDITTNASVNVTSTEDIALAIFLHANGGTNETIQIRADQGTGHGSIELLSDAGGIQLHPGIGVTVGGAINVEATASAVTYSVTQLCGSVIARDPNGVGRTDTTETAANLIAACVPTDGDTHTVLLRNTADAAEAITIAAGVGVILLEAEGNDVIIQQNNWGVQHLCQGGRWLGGNDRYRGD